ncbi:MAG: hypothetical protein ACM3N3_14120 [Betaproteobacteria bacterium]
MWEHRTAAELAGIEAAMAQRSARLIDGAMAEGSFTDEISTGFS